MIKLLLEAPDSSIDPQIKEMISKWSSPPKALEVLEAIDLMVYASLGSDFAVQVMNMVYQECLENEETTHEELIQFATWRNEAQ